MKPAFERAKVEPMTPELFEAMCREHDLTYSYSDDSRAYNDGRDERAAIGAAMKLLPRLTATSIWNNVVAEKILPGPNGADLYFL